MTTAVRPYVLKNDQGEYLDESGTPTWAPAFAAQFPTSGAAMERRRELHLPCAEESYPRGIGWRVVPAPHI